MLPSTIPQWLQTSNFPGNLPISVPRYTQDNALRFPLASSEANLVIHSPTDGLFGYDSHTLWNTQNQNPNILESRWSLAKGRCTFDRKCTKFITVTFSIRPHDLFSSFYVPKLQFMSIHKTTKVTIRIVCAYKIPTFFLNCYIYSTPVCDKLHRIIGTSKA